MISYRFVSESTFTCGWSSSSSWGIYSVSPVRIAWPLASVSLCFDYFFFFVLMEHVEDMPVHTDRTNVIFFQSFVQFPIGSVHPSPKLMCVAALCAVNHCLQFCDVTALSASDLLLYLNYRTLVQRMRGLTGGCTHTKLIFYESVALSSQRAFPIKT